MSAIVKNGVIASGANCHRAQFDNLRDTTLMNLSNDRIEEFRRICGAMLGLRMEMDEARAEATTLMQLYELLARPLPSEVEAHEVAHLSDEKVS